MHSARQLSARSIFRDKTPTVNDPDTVERGQRKLDGRLRVRAAVKQVTLENRYSELRFFR